MFSENELQDFITGALMEDVGSGDHTSMACIPEHDRSSAILLVKDDCILAGVDLALMILKHSDPNCSADVKISDGMFARYGDIAFTVEGNTRALLKAERLLLNCMQRMSAIATLTSRFVAEISGTNVKLLDTRKTTPLIRKLEKWAVKLGGGSNYRSGLYDWIMIKDNHIQASGGVNPALGRVKEYLSVQGISLPVTIEVANLVELSEVLESENNDIVTRIMFDNFELPLLVEGVSMTGGRFETEASGGINLRNIRKYASTGVNFISVGALTHSVESMDLSFKIRRQ